MIPLDLWSLIGHRLLSSSLLRLASLVPSLRSLVLSSDFWRRKYEIFRSHPYYKPEQIRELLSAYSWYQLYCRAEGDDYSPSSVVVLDRWQRFWWHQQHLSDLPPCRLVLDQLCVAEQKIHLLYLSADHQLLELHLFLSGRYFYHSLLTDLISYYQWNCCSSCLKTELACLTRDREFYYIYRGSSAADLPYLTHPVYLGTLPNTLPFLLRVERVEARTLFFASYQNYSVFSAELILTATGEMLVHQFQEKKRD